MNKIKYFAVVMLTLVMGFAMAACSDDDDEKVAEIFKVDQTEFDLNGEVSINSFSVTAKEKPVVAIEIEDKTKDYSWCSVKEVGSEGNVYNYEFSVSDNDDEYSRSLLIKVTSGTKMKEVSVNQNPKAVVVPEGSMNHTATELASLMYAGINIGNTMECPDGEGAWNGFKVNKEYINGLKAAGFNAVRIPCAWASHFSNKKTYTIDESWLKRVRRVVSWCTQNDMYVVLNAHWDNGWLEDNIGDEDAEDDIVAEQKAIWTQVAETFKDFDEHLLFAACNEPGMNESSGNSSFWNDKYAIERVVEYEQTMIDAVRSTGGNNASRTIIVQGIGTSISDTYDKMNILPVDKVENRMMVEVHFYEPYQFALMEKDESWGKMYYFWGKDNKVAGSDRNTPDASAEAWVDAQMKKMYDKFSSKGIPVIIGEYSAMFRNIAENQAEHEKSVAYYGEYVTKVAKNNGCVPFYWETGSVFNRADGTVKKQAVIDGIMKGAQEGHYPW